MKYSNKIKDAYMVFGYACNQKCICCPCDKQSNLEAVIDLEKLKETVNHLCEIGITDVTISGGEPTISPHFFQMIEYISNKGLNIHILSNGEKFSNDEFIEKFIGIVKEKKVSVTITTTFHSYIDAIHEEQNGSKGSFERSMKGLKLLDENGINIALKHCITKYNYKDLKNFIKLITTDFSPRAEIQLWGIDLCGIDKETANKYFVKFEDIKPYIEEALDYFKKINIDDRNQILSINNLPLCMCDCYYWTYYSLPQAHYYIDYGNKNDEELDLNYGTLSLECKNCPFREYCKGTYISVFEVFGDNIVKKPKNELIIKGHKSKYISYDKNNIKKLYFSIYDGFKLTPRGLYIFNKKNNNDVNIRLKSRDLLKLINIFSEGISKDNAQKIFSEWGFDLNKYNVIEEWMIKGILE